MSTGRLEAFSDGVIAIIITIMVLDLKVPLGSSFSVLKPLLPTLLSYALSFVYVGIYWNNHHHMFQVTERVTGGILWANLHLLFWLSLTPFVTGWMGANHFAPVPTALYGIVLLLCAIAFVILQRTILHAPGGNPMLAAALGNDVKGKLSLALYVAGIGLCFVQRWLGFSMYVAVALIWLIPDRRIERRVDREG